MFIQSKHIVPSIVRVHAVLWDFFHLEKPKRIPFLFRFTCEPLAIAHRMENSFYECMNGSFVCESYNIELNRNSIAHTVATTVEWAKTCICGMCGWWWRKATAKRIFSAKLVVQKWVLEFGISSSSDFWSRNFFVLFYLCRLCVARAGTQQQ